MFCIIITAFETSNGAEDCSKILEFSAADSWLCHNYSIRDDEQCEIGDLETHFKVRLTFSSNDTKVAVDPSRSIATIVIDDRAEPECCRLCTFHITASFMLCDILL